MAIEVISKLKPWKNGDFPIIDAVDVSVAETERLDEALARIENKLVIITQDEYVSGDYVAPDGAIVVVIEPDLDEVVGA